MAKAKKSDELTQQIAELTADLQRTRADFENYRKRVDDEKVRMRDMGEMSAIMKLLPVFDVIERAIAHLPEELKGNPWADGVAGLSKQLTKATQELGLERLVVVPGETPFNPELHEAVSADETDGETEVVAEELQAGYILNGQPLRHAMVRVTRK